METFIYDTRWRAAEAQVFFQLPLAYSNNIRFLNLLREREYDKENTQKHGWEKGESQQGAVNGDDHGRCVDIYRTSSETEFKHF